MSDKLNRTIGNRLRRLRVARGYGTAKAFAGYLNLRESRWNNLENGHPLRRDVALLLVQKVPGLSLDWLYLGRSGGLSVQLARDLGLADAPPQTPSRRNSTTS